MEPGRPVRREFEYIRHGTLCLMGAYDVRRGKLFGFTAESRGGDNFLTPLDAVDACYPEGKGHLVMDNLSDHDTDEVNDWFDIEGHRRRCSSGDRDLTERVGDRLLPSLRNMTGVCPCA